MRRALTAVLTLALLVYIAACALLYFKQRSFLYFPSLPVELPEAKAVQFNTQSASLRLWQHELDGPDALIYFGGNGEEVSPNLAVLAAALPASAITIVNYRGYGGSTGQPTEAGLVADALAIYDAVALRHSRISVIGRSLGSGVAVALAAQRKVHRLVLVTPFDSIAQVAKRRFPWLPVGWLLIDQFDSASRIGQVPSKTLIILAERDSIIARERSEALIARFTPEQLSVQTLPGAEHNFLRTRPDYLAALRSFLTAPTS